MNIFPQTKFTASELHDIHEAFSKPAVVKYLHSLAYESGRDLVGAVRNSGESAEEFLGRQALVRGQIAGVETLLKISVENQSASQANPQ